MNICIVYKFLYHIVHRFIILFCINVPKIVHKGVVERSLNTYSINKCLGFSKRCVSNKYINHQ